MQEPNSRSQPQPLTSIAPQATSRSQRAIWGRAPCVLQPEAGSASLATGAPEGGAQRRAASFPRQRGPVPPAERTRRSPPASRPARAHGDHPGPRGSSGDPAATREAGGPPPKGAATGGWIQSKKEQRRAPSPYLEQVEVSPRNPIGGPVAMQQDAKATLRGLGFGWLPLVRREPHAHGAGRQEPGRPGAHRRTLRACAPPPRPPGLRPRVRGSEFSRHWSRKEGPEVPVGGRGKRVGELGSATAGHRAGRG